MPKARRKKGSKRRRLGLLRKALAVLALPPLAAGLASLGRLLVEVSGPFSGRVFLGSFAAYLVLHYAAVRPVGLYVFGHELTHALAAWGTGRRVKALFVGGGEGHVTLSGTSAFIALAPYCFPIYTAAALLLYAGLRAAYGIPGYDPLFYGLMGATLAFHLASTLDTVREASQPDLAQAGGPFLSLVWIAAANEAALALLMRVLFPREVSLAAFALQAVEYLRRAAGLAAGLLP